jgi:NADP-reducing hydrogenase subunit HndB
MAIIKSLDELKKLKEQLQTKVDIREKGDNIDALVQIKIAMGTCGIAAGAKATMDAFVAELSKNGIKNAVITQTGCMGYCHSEPTVQVSIPGKEDVVFGNVNVAKTAEIVEKYIKNGELVDGIIPASHKTL